MKKIRKAIAMVELIFAIVVMGIAMLAIPMITSQSLKGTQSALTQESIAAAASQIAMISAKPWDNTNTQETTPTILTTGSGNFVTRNGLSAGVVNSRILSANAATPVNTDPNNQDMGDFNNIVTLLGINNAQGNAVWDGDYVDQSIQMISGVTYAPDAVNLNQNTIFNYAPAALAVTTNIKHITVTLRTGPAQTDDLVAGKNIVLNAFACNIGSALAATRGF